MLLIDTQKKKEKQKRNAEKCISIFSFNFSEICPRQPTITFDVTLKYMSKRKSCCRETATNLSQLVKNLNKNRPFLYIFLEIYMLIFNNKSRSILWFPLVWKFQYPLISPVFKQLCWLAKCVSEHWQKLKLKGRLLVMEINLCYLPKSICLGVNYRGLKCDHHFFNIKVLTYFTHFKIL